MASHELQVSGMICDHCARTVEQALSGVAGVERTAVSYPEGKVRVEAQDAVKSTALVAVIEAEGYAAQLLHGGKNVTGTTLYVDSGYHAMGM